MQPGFPGRAAACGGATRGRGDSGGRDLGLHRAGSAASAARGAAAFSSAAAAPLGTFRDGLGAVRSNIAGRSPRPVGDGVVRGFGGGRLPPSRRQGRLRLAGRGLRGLGGLRRLRLAGRGLLGGGPVRRRLGGRLRGRGAVRRRLGRLLVRSRAVRGRRRCRRPRRPRRPGRRRSAGRRSARSARPSTARASSSCCGRRGSGAARRWRGPASSSARRSRIISPRSGCVTSRPRNMIVILTLSLCCRKRVDVALLGRVVVLRRSSGGT